MSSNPSKRRYTLNGGKFDAEHYDQTGAVDSGGELCPHGRASRGGREGGADRIHVDIKELGKLAGVVINPATPPCPAPGIVSTGASSFGCRSIPKLQK